MGGPWRLRPENRGERGERGVGSPGGWLPLPGACKPRKKRQQGSLQEGEGENFSTAWVQQRVKRL